MCLLDIKVSEISVFVFYGGEVVGCQSGQQFFLFTHFVVYNLLNNCYA